MSRILDYVLEPSVVYTNGSFLVKVKVQDDYKYKKLLVSERMKYTTATGTTYTLTNAVSTNNASILQLEGNTTQTGTPTPTNPIPIYTVSGDNEVVVCGKNLLGTVEGNYSYSTTHTWSISKEKIIMNVNNIEYQGGSVNLLNGKTSRWAGDAMTKEKYIDNVGTYTLSIRKNGNVSFGNNGNIFLYYNVFINGTENRRSLAVSKTSDISQVTITLSSGQYITDMVLYSQFVSCDNLELQIQLEKGSTATTYEQYQGDKYRIDFGGKNEFHDYYQITDTNNGITRTLTDNGIKLNGTYNKNANMDLWLTKSTSAGYSNNMTLLKANTQYTISIRAISGSFNISNITCNLSSRTVADKTFAWNYQTLTLSNNVWKKTFTPTTDIYVGGVRFYFHMSNTTAVFNNAELGIQIEKGATDTQFSPYVSNPIELCKIGNYVDTIFKAETGNPTYDSLDDTTKASLTYGNWYIEKNIGKVVYNGTENWYFTSNCCYTNNIVNTVKRPPNNNTKANIICDHYQLDTLANCYNNVTDKRISVNNGGYLYIYDTSFTSANAIKTWLTTNNVTVYYALATPSYEIITNENLLEQLNNIQNIELIENLCYLEWVGEEKPTMTLQYPTNETLNAYITTEDNKLIRTDWGV